MFENVSLAPADGGKQFVRVKAVTEHFPGLKTFTFEADGVKTRTLAPARAGKLYFRDDKCRRKPRDAGVYACVLAA